MLCHKCPHAAEIARLRDICMKCSDREIEHPSGIGYGNSLVSLDAMVDAEAIINKQAVKTPTSSCDETHTKLPFEVEKRLRDELASFLSLSFLNQMLLIWILRGESLSEFSRMDWLPKEIKGGNGFITRQTVFERVKTLKRNMPSIATAIEQMIALNSGSRNKQKVKSSKKKRD
jgi:hypothetical protein